MAATSMKIILSVDSVRYPLTGIGRYTYELASALQMRSDLSLLMLSGDRLVATLTSDRSDPQSAQDMPRSLSQAIYRRLRRSRTAVETAKALKDALAKHSLRKHKGAIFHGTNFYLGDYNGPSVATFHDISVFTFAHYHPPERVSFMQRQMKITMDRADMLITVSNSARKEIACYFGYPLEKIRAIPLGCSDAFRPRATSETRSVLERYGLEHGRYVLFTGTVEPRKNIEGLLDAYSALPEQLRTNYPLVIAGFQGWKSERLHARIAAAANAGWARYLGYARGEDLPLLYAGAHLFIFPSHYEGFGLPVLESMASGVPVVCSSSSSLPEVVGDAALTCKPEDTDGLRELIRRGLDDTQWRLGARARGLKRAAEFSWHRCAEQTVEVYRQLQAGAQA